MVSAGASHTDSSGHYRIDGLPEGLYVILGSTGQIGGSERGGSGLIIFAGSGLRPSKARTVAVKGSSDYAGVDIIIPLIGVREVSGIVTGPDGHRLNHGLVRLYPTGEPRFPLSTPVQADGTFSFHRIPQDRYTVLLEEATDMAVTPKSNGGLTVIQKYGPVSADIEVANADLTDVKLVVAPVK